MTISCIVAMARNRVIGLNNDIPWYLPADLKYFKITTTGHAVIMGRNCYASIGRPLPNRTNIIITRDPFFISSNCIIARSVSEALSAAYDIGEAEAFIIGGGQIYEQTQDLWNRLYLTEVDLDITGDVHFPDISMDQWSLTNREEYVKDEKNEWNYAFNVYERK